MKKSTQTRNNSIAVIGLSFGDEGKGKITDYLAQKADIVVRFQGGNNAGHTVVHNEKKFKFHIMPSGAVLEKEIVIANGCVVDPKVLLEEMEKLRSFNKSIHLKLSSTAHVIFPFHRILDGLEEQAKTEYRVGTTKRGIGPTYADKAARYGLRIFDLIHPELLKKKLTNLYRIKSKLIQYYEPDWNEDFEAIFEEYKGYGEKLKKYVVDSAYFLNKAIDSGKKIIFEGAQGTLLGIDHGFYPFVTSSNSNALGISCGTGIPPKKIGPVLGVIKAYTSRVGKGFVPTELKNEVGDKIREQGHEYGTTTGRPRRVGWLDLFNIKYSVMINGVKYIAIMLLDALEGINPLQICIGYEMEGRVLESWPIHPEKVKECIPIYKTFKGWETRPREEWQRIAKEGYESLPEEIKKYVSFIADELNTKIGMLSIGPERDSTIVLDEFF
ncbi:MAG: Adenylosuccinate synthetase [Promethearchaeota archaeon]|nr:MAG: Adenylosuccinate synthetase [Candidatus Lokiarchaeota archaeon]